GHPRFDASQRAFLGAQQLAKLLCSTARGRRSEAGNAVAAETWNPHTAGYHVLPPRARLRQRILGGGRNTGRKRTRPGSVCSSSSLSSTHVRRATAYRFASARV